MYKYGDLKKKTLAELKELAKEHEINLHGETKKQKILMIMTRHFRDDPETGYTPAHLQVEDPRVDDSQKPRSAEPEDAPETPQEPIVEPNRAPVDPEPTVEPEEPQNEDLVVVKYVGSAGRYYVGRYKFTKDEPFNIVPVELWDKISSDPDLEKSNKSELEKHYQ